MEKLYFEIGTALMVLGAAAFLIMGRSDAPEKQHHYVMAFFVAAVAATSYLGMAIGQGSIGVYNANGTLDHTLYYARYMDWSITTPLLLLSIGSIAVTHLRNRGTLLAGLIGADLLMIVTGLFGGLSTGANVYIWFGVSTGAFLAVLWLVWGALKREADQQTGGWGALYSRLAGLLSVLWIAYPIVFLIGQEGTKLLSSPLETLIFMVLDVTAKVVFGFVFLTGVKPLAERAPETAVTTLDNANLDAGLGQTAQPLHR